jgi:hypothetical protein
VLPYAPKPVIGVPGIRLDAVDDSVPIIPFRGRDILRAFMAFFPGSESEVESTQGGIGLASAGEQTIRRCVFEWLQSRPRTHFVAGQRQQRSGAFGQQTGDGFGELLGRERHSRIRVARPLIRAEVA